MEVNKEYDRIKALFENADEKQLELMDGAILEAAKMRVELNRLNDIKDRTGLLKVNPNNEAQQKELPVAKLLLKARANYLNYMTKLASMLGVDPEEDDDMNEYE